MSKTHRAARPRLERAFLCAAVNEGRWDEEALPAGKRFRSDLSFNDSGIVLSEMLGISTFRERVAALAA
jgi:hypothetical protein